MRVGIGPKVTAIVLAAFLALPALAGASALSARVSSLCRTGHLEALCSQGHYVTVKGHRIFTLGRFEARTRAHAANTGWQHLWNHGTGLCASDYYGWNDYVKQYACNGSANQTWNVNCCFGSLWYVISNAGQCWNTQYGSYSTYTDIIDYRCDGSYLNEQFRIYANNGNGLNFNTAVNDECVSGMGYYTYGSYVELFPCNYNNNQTWGAASRAGTGRPSALTLVPVER